MQKALGILLMVAGVVVAVVCLCAFAYDSTTSTSRGGLVDNVQHDGHLFVVLTGTGGGICHHPDCRKCRVVPAVESSQVPAWMTNGVYIPCITSLNQYIGTTKWIRVDPAEYERFFRGYYSVTSGWDSLVSQLPVLE